MHAEKTENRIAVHLTADEVFTVQAGRIVGGRTGVTLPDAKIEVLPLSAFQEDRSTEDRYENDRLEKGLAATVAGYLYSNGDLQIVIPGIALTDVRIWELKLPREAINFDEAQETDRRMVESFIPQEGVIVHLGGSLQKVNVDDHFIDVNESD